MDDEVIKKLTDISLSKKFLDSKATKETFKKVMLVLDKHNVANAEAVIADLIPYLIPPGVKGVVRGLAFNQIVMDWLNEHYEGVEFEKNIDGISERPDWYILHNNHYIVGYNQIDLWSGGAQTNRGNKYILDDSFHEKNSTIKYVSVIASKPDKISPKLKKLFEVGISKKRMTYLSGLESIIDGYIKQFDAIQDKDVSRSKDDNASQSEL